MYMIVGEIWSPPEMNLGVAVHLVGASGLSTGPLVFSSGAGLCRSPARSGAHGAAHSPDTIGGTICCFIQSVSGWTAAAP